MSLDGYVTGPNDRPGAGLGDGGERLHYWVFGGPWTYATGAKGRPAAVDQAYLDRVLGSGGAWLVGRTVHDVVDGWGDGIAVALAKAREAAGDRNVILMGGANLLAQYLDAGAVDELTVTVAPTLLGAGGKVVSSSRGRARGRWP